jgi:hypothetical protein
VADFLADKRKEIEARMRELKPLMDEYQQLEAAAAALAGVGSSATRSANGRRRGPGRPRGSRTRARASTRRAGTRRRGRPRGSGTRAVQALALVRSQPGITIREMADRMGIAQNYLYRVLPGLQEQGHVTRRGRGWHPKGGSGSKGSGSKSS